MLEKRSKASANQMRPRNKYFSALDAEQVTVASLLIFAPKLRKVSSKSPELESGTKAYL
uniref:Uncharacterized protein n=1 Tax=Romanomermis culicivorax TaxID=13658 RepID=A0A915KC85_ROMCU